MEYVGRIMLDYERLMPARNSTLPPSPIFAQMSFQV
jgi:hypothetical protein